MEDSNAPVKLEVKIYLPTISNFIGGGGGIFVNTESTTTNLIKKLTKITCSMRVVHFNPIPPPRSSQSHAQSMQIIKQHSSGWLYSYTATCLYNLFFLKYM